MSQQDKAGIIPYHLYTDIDGLVKATVRFTHQNELRFRNYVFSKNFHESLTEDELREFIQNDIERRVTDEPAR